MQWEEGLAKSLCLLSAYVKAGTNPAEWFSAVDSRLDSVEEYATAGLRYRVSKFATEAGFVWITITREDFRVFSCMGVSRRSEFRGLENTGVLGARVEGVVVPLDLAMNAVSVLLGGRLSDTERYITCAYLRKAWEGTVAEIREQELAYDESFSPFRWVARLETGDEREENRYRAAAFLDFFANHGEVFEGARFGKFLDTLLDKRFYPQQLTLDGSCIDFLMAFHEYHSGGGAAFQDEAKRLARLLLAWRRLTPDGSAPFTICVEFIAEGHHWHLRGNIGNNGLTVAVPAKPVERRNSEIENLHGWIKELGEGWQTEIVRPRERQKWLPESFLDLAARSGDDPLTTLVGLMEKYGTAWDGCELLGADLDKIAVALRSIGPEMLVAWEQDVALLFENRPLTPPEARLLTRLYPRVCTVAVKGPRPLQRLLSRFAGPDVVAQVGRAMARIHTNLNWPSAAARCVDDLVDAGNWYDIGRYLIARLPDRSHADHAPGWLESLSNALAESGAFDEEAARIADMLFERPRAEELVQAEFAKRVCQKALGSRQLSPRSPRWQIICQGFGYDPVTCARLLNENPKSFVYEFISAYQRGHRLEDILRRCPAPRPDEARHLRKALEEMFGARVDADSMLGVYCAHPDSVPWQDVQSRIGSPFWMKSVTPTHLSSVEDHFQLYCRLQDWPSSISRLISTANRTWQCRNLEHVKHLLRLATTDRGGASKHEIVTFAREKVAATGFCDGLKPVLVGLVALAVGENETARSVLRQQTSHLDGGMVCRAMQSVWQNQKERQEMEIRLVENLPESIGLSLCKDLWKMGELPERVLATYARNPDPRGTVGKVLAEIRRDRTRGVSHMSFVRVEPILAGASITKRTYRPARMYLRHRVSSKHVGGTNG